MDLTAVSAFPDFPSMGKKCTRYNFQEPSKCGTGKGGTNIICTSCNDARSREIMLPATAGSFDEVRGGIRSTTKCGIVSNAKFLFSHRTPYGALQPCSPLSKRRQRGGKVKLKCSHSPDISALYHCPLITITLSAVYPPFDSYPQSIVTLARPVRSLASLYLHETFN